MCGGDGPVDYAKFEQYMKARNVTEQVANDEYAQLTQGSSSGLLDKAAAQAWGFTFFASPDPSPEKWLLGLFSVRRARPPGGAVAARHSRQPPRTALDHEPAATPLGPQRLLWVCTVFGSVP
ncbi:hypothetical protein ABTZ03_14985 [Kitasatospora sp. NPDC096077]|uniref:hypothetical protein n=1 Tax=Kitasatospora sp. NPDC096077 TaxID=3155544 RepID=UPI003330CDFB